MRNLDFGAVRIMRLLTNQKVVFVAAFGLAEFVMDMSKVLVRTSRKYAVRASSRAFSSCSSIRDEKPVLNKYSRTVTQPKDQGASQASFEFDLWQLIACSYQLVTV
jgi:hypothetical protein